MTNCNINSENFILKQKKIFIEIPVFLIYFAFTFSDCITTNFIKYRTCYVIFDFKEPNCALLEANSSSRVMSILERKVQPSSIVINSTVSIIQSLIPPLLCFFIGPWSNQYGRKPIMLYSTFALIIQYAIMVFISAVPHMSPWYILIAQVLLCASGGIPALVTVIFSYITDTVKAEQRGIRTAFLEAIRSCGILLGLSTAMTTLNYSSYITVYALSVTVLVMACLFIWLYVPESMLVTQSQNKPHSFFDFGSIITTVKTIFKVRENYNRLSLLTVMLVIIFYITTISGGSSVLFMYFQNEFHWNITGSSNYSIIIYLTTITGGMICAYFIHMKLSCSELIAITAALVSLLTGSFTLAMASSLPVIHFGACMQCFGPAVLSMAKTYLSTLVPQEEISSIFAVVASLETIFALVGASIFAVIYNSTSSSNSATFLFVTSALYLLQLIIVSALLLIQKYWNPVRFRPIENEIL